MIEGGSLSTFVVERDKFYSGRRLFEGISLPDASACLVSLLTASLGFIFFRICVERFRRLPVSGFFESRPASPTLRYFTLSQSEIILFVQSGFSFFCDERSSPSAL